MALKDRVTILPLLLKSKTSTFNFFDMTQYPDDVHAHPNSPKALHVRDVMKGILEYQGVETSKEDIAEYA